MPLPRRKFWRILLRVLRKVMLTLPLLQPRVYIRYDLTSLREATLNPLVVRV